jgi:hypothetical protein
LCLSRHGRSPVIEIAPILDDDASASVVERLLREKPLG